MIIGTRAVYAKEVGLWDAELLQISVYRNMDNNLAIMNDCIRACRESNINYVIHPVGYSLLNDSMFKTLTLIAESADSAVILHDERTPEGERLAGKDKALFQKAVDELSSMTQLSFENANNTGDIHWFWTNFADSVTIDIGHIEAAGFNSVDFIKSLHQDIIDKTQFVHMHRNSVLRGGITDHWPLSRDCREIRALKEFIKRKDDVSVILELNETAEIGESLHILRELRNSFMRQQ